MIRKVAKKLDYYFKRKAFALSYHRIADIAVDPWQLAVTPAHFEEQLALLDKNFEVVSAAELVRRFQKNALTSREVCVTFDDGYYDNYVAAKPLLEKYNTPAVFFIPTYYLGKREPFWWDELKEIILGASNLPKVLSVKIRDEDFYFDLEDDHIYTSELGEQHKSWVSYKNPPTRRAILYLEIWKKIRPLTLEEIQPLMMKLKEWAAFKGAAFNDLDFPINYDQLAELAQHPLFEIGIHTVTHPALADHTFEFQLKEISEGKSQLEKLCGNEIDIIAYPYGYYNQDTLRVAENLHLKAGFTTLEKAITRESKQHSFGRIQAKNWDGKTFGNALSKWKTGLNF